MRPIISAGVTPTDCLQLLQPSPLSTFHPSHPALRVRFGQATFHAEGQEAPGTFFSRQIHWPGGVSGVTIGRGYDMSQRTQIQVRAELIRAGLSEHDALSLSTAAGLSGKAAESFVRTNVGAAPILPLEVQTKLFEDVTAPQIIADIKRIFSKPDVVRTYGEVLWDTLPPQIQELVFDLRYRGDYNPQVRMVLQPCLIAQDFDSLRRLMADSQYWAERNVPKDRILRRLEIINNLHAPLTSTGLDG